ncbi:hypothetical protein FRB99_005799 [Tulasnella sp. 403]|nr:hypothetical protein FRB99_005799 [Tulasnella sp. 403]
MDTIPRSLNPASKESVYSALLTLVDGINKANGTEVSIDPSKQIAEPSVDQMETMTSVLEEALESLRFEVRTRIATIQKRRNALVPCFSRLPTELLADIILLACSVREGHIPKYTLYYRLYQFAQVSTLWHDVVRRTPRLWAFIDSSHLPTMELFLRKSKDSPLTIQLWGGDGELPALAPSAARWRSLYMMHMNIRGRVECVEVPTPLLQRLTLYNEAVLNHTPIWNMSGGPQLRTLILTRIVLDWSVGTFSGLTKLSISRIHEESLALSAFLGVLAGCEKLGSLSIIELRPPPSPLPLLLGSSRIFLACLTDLHIEAVSHRTAHALFDRLEAPALRHLIFRHKFQGPEDPEPVFGPIADTANARKLVVTTFTNAHSERWPNTVLVSHGFGYTFGDYEYPRVPIHLMSDGYTTHSSVKRAADLIPLNSLGLPIELVLYTGPAEDVDVQFLKEMDMLSVLRAEQVPRSKIIDLLLFPGPLDEATDDWPCPNLQVASILKGQLTVSEATNLEKRNESLRQHRETLGGPSGVGWGPFRKLEL